MSPVSAWASKWIIDTRPAPMHVGAALGVGVGDRVVPAKGDRYRPGPGHLLHRRLERRQGDLDVAGVHLHITGVVDLRSAQTVGPQCQRRPRSVVWQVVGHPDGLRAEPGAGSVGGAAVERRPQDHDVRVGVAALVVQIAFRHAEKGEVGPNCGAVR